jgi:hypothetical protein
MDQRQIDLIINTYLEARLTVIESGYAPEVDWQENVSFEKLDECTFLRECAWVILSSGMKEKIIRHKFIELTPIFFDWISSAKIHGIVPLFVVISMAPGSALLLSRPL